MNAKRPACKSPKKPQWQPEHWLMLWEIVWKRLHLVILATLLGVACLIRPAVAETSSWDSIKELLSQVFTVR
jgi:hypothetical protein